MNNFTFTTWASNTLAELEAPTGGGLQSCHHSDHIRILRAAVRHGDELLYDIEMASLDGDAYRWEDLSNQMRQRESASRR
tara:strand:- start:565 stop:804 length:240 start_codon:yes stop_codon:yes gene_type:complete